MQLKEDLTLSTCGPRTITEFLHGIKVIANELAIIDHPVSNDDLTLYILNGLGPEFREITAPIRARETSLKFEEIHDFLVGHELPPTAGKSIGSNICSYHSLLSSVRRCFWTT